MRSNYGRRIVFLLCLVAAACSSGSDSASGSATQLSPLEDSVPGSLAFETRVAAAGQDAVLKCMLNEGFEYVSQVPAGLADLVEAGLDRDEFTNLYGYGVATLFELRAGSLSASEDPNVVIRQAMTPGERDAYDVALYGSTLADLAQEGTLSGDGCINAPVDALKSTFSLQGVLIDVQNRMESDPRVISLATMWVTCMRDKGYEDADSLKWGRFHIERRLIDILSVAVILSKDGEVLQQNSPIDELLQSTVELDEDLMAELEDDELRIARADRDCLLEFEDDFGPIMQEYSDAFLEETSDLAVLAADELNDF